LRTLFFLVFSIVLCCFFFFSNPLSPKPAILELERIHKHIRRQLLVTAAILKMSGLDYAQLAIYGPLSLPILFIVYRHGRRGVIGWLYLFVFCTLRIVGPAMQIKANKDHTSGSGPILISSIGLSPLLLATVGILHEA
jgi:hypothetical protein